MFFAYVGFDAVSTAAQEARRPQRDMPIGILASLGICTVLYIAVALVLIGIVPYPRLNVADPLAVGIDATGLTWLSPVIKVVVLVLFVGLGADYVRRGNLTPFIPPNTKTFDAFK